MRLKGILVLALAISMNLSVCTGGLFIIPVTFASEANSTPAPIDIAMSVMSCFESTGNNIDELGSTFSGCDDKKICLSLTHQRVRERMFVMINNADSDYKDTIDTTYSIEGFSAYKYLVALNEPLYPDSSRFTRSIVKIE